jgi:hypothetical protein
MITQTKGVRTQHPDYATFSAKWSRCRDAIAGQDAIHDAGTTYLKKLKDETPDDYAARKQRAGFFNATWRTINGLTGMMFRKDPKLTVPAKIEPYLADVTLAGQSFATLTKAVAYEVMAVGRVGVLVDHPPRPENVAAITEDIAQKLGLRPTMQIYQAESIINWSYRRIANQHTLAMVVLTEAHVERVDEFETKTETRYRVLDLNPEAGDTYRMRVFRIDEKGKDELVAGGETIPLMDGKPLDRIPLKVIGPDGEEMTLDEPPLIDLVDLNLAHYRVTADYEHGCHFTGLPTAVVSGYQPEDTNAKLYIGSQAAWVFPDPNAKAVFLEFTGTGLGALESNLDRKERQMAVVGARMIADEKSQVETLGATAIKRTGENSILSAVAIAVSEALQAQLEVFAAWASAPGKVEFEINRKFLATPMDAQTLTALVGAWQSGALSEAELFEQLQGGDVIDGGKTFAAHQGEVEVAAPPAPVKPPVPANQGAGA